MSRLWYFEEVELIKDSAVAADQHTSMFFYGWMGSQLSLYRAPA